MGEVSPERATEIMAATERLEAIGPELDKMRHLARLSAWTRFETCEAAFARRADVLEREKERALGRLVSLCTDGSAEASGMCREAIEEITTGARSDG